MDNNKIGKFITHLRKEKGLTQKELGDKLFVTDKAVSKWERGLSLPDISLLENLAKELDVDTSEILTGAYGSKKIDTKEEIDKILTKIELDKEAKQKKIKKIVMTIFAILLIISIILFGTLKIYYDKYHPSIIKEGDNNYLFGYFGDYSLEKNGLDELVKIIDKTENKGTDKSNISFMKIRLNKDGEIKSLIVNLDYFDGNSNYIGMGRYEYKSKKLHYEYKAKENCADVNECNIGKSLVKDYLKSSNVEYVSAKLKNIPFKKQIKMSNLKYYEVDYSKTYYQENTKVFDMRDNKHINPLPFSDYKQGKGGMALPGSYLQITLSNGSSTIDEEIYRYIFDFIQGDVPRVDNSMEKDYYINGKNELLFTRDYGNTWIKTDITSDDIDKTLNYYGDILLKHSSWFISTNELIPIAYFYSEDPKLKISTDNGKTWTEKEFNLSNAVYDIPIPNRIVGFTNQNFGYVALGTDWTMGGGEIKQAYFTYDSGKNWSTIDLPENGSRHTLIDFIMYDSKVGIIALEGETDSQFPILYSTVDGGKNWIKVNYLGINIPDNIQYLYSLDNIEYHNNNYYITLGQGETANTKVKFKTNDMSNWNYDSQFKENIHTVG